MRGRLEKPPALARKHSRFCLSIPIGSNESRFCRNGSRVFLALLINPAEREYRTWIFDSRRWRHYRPRHDDIIIATYPKCGTIWMQRIVSLLVFQTAEPKPIMQISAWIDRRFPQPIEAVVAQIEAQEHRRFLKSHLPLDGLPFYGEVK